MQFYYSAPTITSSTQLTIAGILINPCRLTGRMIRLHSHHGLDALYFCLAFPIPENSRILRNKHRLWNHLPARLWRNNRPVLSFRFHISQVPIIPTCTVTMKVKWHMWEALLMLFHSLPSTGSCGLLLHLLINNESLLISFWRVESFQAQGLSL